MVDTQSETTDRLEEFVQKALPTEQRRILKLVSALKKEGAEPVAPDKVLAEIANTVLPLLADLGERVLEFRREVSAELLEQGQVIESIGAGIVEGDSQLIPADAEIITKTATGLHFIAEQLLAGSSFRIDDPEQVAKLQELKALAERTITLVNEISMDEVDEDEEGEDEEVAEEH